MNRALADKEVLDVLRTAGMVTTGGTADRLKNLLQQDTLRWAPVVKASGARLD